MLKKLTLAEEKFFTAIKERTDKETVRKYLESKEISPDVVSANGTPAIFYTIKFYPSPEMLSILLSYGVHVNLNDMPDVIKNKNYSPVVALVDQGFYLYYHGDMEENSETYNNFFEYAKILKKYVKLTEEESKEIKNIIGTFDETENDCLYDEHSFARKLSDLFENEYHEKYINLEGDALELYRAKKEVDVALDTYDLTKTMAESPDKIEFTPGLAQDFVKTAEKNLQIANQLLSGIIAKTQQNDKKSDDTQPKKICP